MPDMTLGCFTCSIESVDVEMANNLMKMINEHAKDSKGIRFMFSVYPNRISFPKLEDFDMETTDD